jgi:DNA repair exonuclease SbcCD ATPase subunit
MKNIFQKIKLYWNKFLSLFKKKKMSLNEVNEFNKKILEDSIKEHKKDIENREKENKELTDSIDELEKIDGNIEVSKEIIRKEKRIKDNNDDIELSKQRIERYKNELESINGSN